MYELSKYLTNELIVKLQSVDDVEVPQDFTQDDHIHLNAEVSVMQTPLTQDYILETEEGRYYKDTVSIYAGNKVTHKVLETTTDVYKATV